MSSDFEKLKVGDKVILYDTSSKECSVKVVQSICEDISSLNSQSTPHAYGWGIKVNNCWFDWRGHGSRILSNEFLCIYNEENLKKCKTFQYRILLDAFNSYYLFDYEQLLRIMEIARENPKADAKFKKMTAWCPEDI